MTADENPALDPTRLWRVGGQDVAFDARALIRKLDGDGRGLLQFLAEHATRGPIDSIELSAIMKVEASTIETVVNRVNMLAGALGYVSLILGSHEGVCIEAEAAPVVIRGILDARS